MFWDPKPKNVEDFIEKERRLNEEKRRRYISEYEKARKRQQEPARDEDREGPSRKEKIMAGAKKAGQVIKKLHEYEPSESTKRDIRKSFKYARSEVSELGRISPRPRERYRSADDDEITWDQYFGGDKLSGYAESMTPPGLRMDWQGQQTSHRYSSDRYDPYIEYSGGLPTQEIGDAGFVNPLEGFDLSFSNVASGKSRRGRSEADLYFNPLAGYDDYFTQLAGGKRKRRR